MLMFLGNVYKRAKLMVMDTREKNIDIGKDFVDSHLLEIMDCDLYQQLRASEVNYYVLKWRESIRFCFFAF